MSRIPLTGSFSIIPEGEHVLKITAATYKEEFGKIKLTMETKDGAKHFENFSLIKTNGETNDGACSAFSVLAKTALRNPSLEDVDIEELVGTYIKGTIVHESYTGADGKAKTTTRKANGTWWTEVSDGEIDDFEGRKKVDTLPASLDLNALLGR